MESVQPAMPVVKGFAMVPHALVADDRLNPTDKTVAFALPYWAHQRGECYPSNATLGRHLNVDARTIRRSLANLATYGWVKLVKDESLPTGRRIVLSWFSDIESMQSSCNGGWTNMTMGGGQICPPKNKEFKNKEAFDEEKSEEETRPFPRNRLTVNQRMMMWEGLKDDQGFQFEEGPLESEEFCY